jgi:hypothetical protein
MARSGAVGNGVTDDDIAKDGRITYRRRGGKSLIDSSAFLPGVVIVSAAVVAVLIWFFWGAIDDDISPAPGVSSLAERTLAAASEAASSGGAGYLIHLGKDKFYPAEVIVINVSATPRPMIDANAVIGIRAANGALLSRGYVNRSEEILRLRVPAEAGDYEVVGYDNGAELNDARIVARAPFAVEGASDGAFSVTLDKREYRPSEPIGAFVSGAPRGMREDSAIIGVCRAEAPSGGFISYEYVRRESEILTIRAPREPGDYEMRAFTNGAELSELTMAARIPFSVGGSALGTFAASLPKPRYAPRETMEVMVAGVPRYMLDDGAVAVLCKAGAEHGKFISSKNITAPNGSCEFEAPSGRGNYEIRCYTNGDILTEETLAAVAQFRVGR